MARPISPNFCSIAMYSSRPFLASSVTFWETVTPSTCSLSGSLTSDGRSTVASEYAVISSLM